MLSIIQPILIKNSTATDQKFLLSINLLFPGSFPSRHLFPFVERKTWLAQLFRDSADFVWSQVSQLLCSPFLDAASLSWISPSKMMFSMQLPSSIGVPALTTSIWSFWWFFLLSSCFYFGGCFGPALLIYSLVSIPWGSWPANACMSTRLVAGVLAGVKAVLVGRVVAKWEASPSSLTLVASRAILLCKAATLAGAESGMVALIWRNCCLYILCEEPCLHHGLGAK